MVNLDVSGLSAIRFSADTTVTAPDGNPFIVKAQVPEGVPRGLPDNIMLVGSSAGVQCMLVGSGKPRDSLPVFVTDTVRTPV